MGIKNVFNQKFVSKAPNPKEEALYKRVLDEIESGKTRTGIMAKALADSLGDKGKAESLYIKYRMQTLADEDKYEARQSAIDFKHAQEKEEKEAKEKELRDIKLAQEKLERESQIANEKWKKSKRYKLFNFSRNASPIYIIIWMISALFIPFALIFAGRYIFL
tara:strand:+ start:67 stop:555 length:489 start_codon:yes stop_codon:yes gene_type:complete